MVDVTADGLEASFEAFEREDGEVAQLREEVALLKARATIAVCRDTRRESFDRTIETMLGSSRASRRRERLFRLTGWRCQSCLYAAALFACPALPLDLLPCGQIGYHSAANRY